MPFLRLYYHIVWSTRDRLPLISESDEAIIRRSFELTCKDLKLIPHAIGFMPDHVHIAVSVPATISLAEAVRRLKGASSHAVNKFGSRPNGEKFEWQGEYGALTFGDQALVYVMDYVVNQRERHANQRIAAKMENSG